MLKFYLIFFFLIHDIIVNKLQPRYFRDYDYDSYCMRIIQLIKKEKNKEIKKRLVAHFMLLSCRLNVHTFFRNEYIYIYIYDVILLTLYCT